MPTAGAAASHSHTSRVIVLSVQAVGASDEANPGWSCCVSFYLHIAFLSERTITKAMRNSVYSDKKLRLQARFIIPDTQVALVAPILDPGHILTGAAQQIHSRFWQTTADTNPNKTDVVMSNTACCQQPN